MMMFIETICILTLFFVFSGFAIYKFGGADTWEDGIKEAFSILINFFYEGATGKTLSSPDKEIDVRLYLSSEEMIGLTEELEEVYEHPRLINGIIYTEDAAWFDYSTYDIKPKYKNLSIVERKRLVSSIVEKYYQKIHGTFTLPIYVKICSDYRLYFALALSKAGKTYLDKQELLNSCNEKTSYSTDTCSTITESIPEDSEDAFRL